MMDEWISEPIFHVDISTSVSVSRTTSQGIFEKKRDCIYIFLLNTPSGGDTFTEAPIDVIKTPASLHTTTVGLARHNDANPTRRRTRSIVQEMKMKRSKSKLDTIG